jgi:hypothetical protein
LRQALKKNRISWGLNVGVLHEYMTGHVCKNSRVNIFSELEL